jgi:hypothetical protein
MQLGEQRNAGESRTTTALVPLGPPAKQSISSWLMALFWSRMELLHAQTLSNSSKKFFLKKRVPSLSEWQCKMQNSDTRAQSLQNGCFENSELAAKASAIG